ncbi:MAG: hypothetical protein CMF60_03565 [Magnetococcales bacterium]|nr:hypothetical protein [Magnetococcales bacterium]
MADIQKIGIIAGGGTLPDLMVKHCQKTEKPFHMVCFKGQPQPQNWSDYKIFTTELGLGQVGKVVETFKEKQVTDIVMAGNLEKPSLFDLRFDMAGLKLMNQARRKHDDELLNAVCTFLTEQGFNVLGAHELAPEILMPKGLLSQRKPNASQKTDLEIGLETLAHLSTLDIGQAVVVKDGVVLGVEAVEGTSRLIERCATLRGAKDKGGVLVKAAKAGQNLKVDMPAIGDETLEKLAELHYDGVAVLAGQAMFLAQEKALKVANKNGLFVCGVDENGQYA